MANMVILFRNHNNSFIVSHNFRYISSWTKSNFTGVFFQWKYIQKYQKIFIISTYMLYNDIFSKQLYCARIINWRIIGRSWNNSIISNSIFWSFWSVDVWINFWWRKTTGNNLCNKIAFPCRFYPCIHWMVQVLSFNNFVRSNGFGIGSIIMRVVIVILLLLCKLQTYRRIRLRFINWSYVFLYNFLRLRIYNMGRFLLYYSE